MQLPEEGAPLRTKDILEVGPFVSLFVGQGLFENRRPGAKGYYQGWVPGHGGDLWFVSHDGGKTAVYLASECELEIREGAAHRMASRDNFEEVHVISSMPLEEVRAAIAAICKHFQLGLERRKEYYGGVEYRVVPEGS